MKTPIQELFEQITEYQITKGHIPMEVQQQFLEKEKQVIIDAYYAGTAQFDNAAEIVRPKTPQDYYEETFNKQ